MSKVTALGMDVITEQSAHAAVPMAPSACLTPAAPVPVPVPYPVAGTSAEGLIGATSHTKVCGAKVGTVGSAFSAVHGNEPGTLGEVVSLTTGGPAPLMLGGPTVLFEQGMVGITGSLLMANRGVGPTWRTAPFPAMGPVSVPGFAVLGGGVLSGGSDGGNAGASAGRARASGSNGGDEAKGDGRNAPSTQPGQCQGGHPVDIITGRAYTLPAVDLELPGPLPLVFMRSYSTTASERDVGLGFGWASSWGWEIEVRRRELRVWTDEGIAVDFPLLDAGDEYVGWWGWILRCERDRFVLDIGDGVLRVFAAADEVARRWQLIEIRDRNDNRIELTYDEAGHLCEVIDSAGRTVRVQATRAGRIAALEVNNARAQGRWVAVARFTYDARGNLTAAVDAEGQATRYAYDEEHRLIRETDRTGLAFCFKYDRAGRCTETWGEYPGGRDPSLAEDVPAMLADHRTRARGVHHVCFEYGPDRYTEVIDSTQIRRYYGNRYGLASKWVEGSGVEDATYDERGLVLTHTDGEGAITRYERDDRGRVMKVTDPLGRVTTYERDARRDLVGVIDPAGGTYDLQRDDRGNVIHRADPTGAVWSYAYDARGLVTSATSPTGGVTRYAYDTEGNLIKQTDTTGAPWHWAYDARGRCTLALDPLGHETRYTWTERGDLAAVHDRAGGVTRYTYDGERERTEIQGPGRRSEGLAWGGFHRLVQQTDPNGASVRYRYNREGALTEVHNEVGELHRLRRDGAGRVTREETFDGRAITYGRDNVGRVVRTDVAGDVTEYVYSEAGELVSRTFSDETTESFTYDARGEMVRATWPGGEILFERDAAGRVVREEQVLGGEVEYVKSAYNLAGARVLRTTSRGHVERVERDTAGVRTRTILDERHDVHHALDPLGREVLRALPRGGHLHHTYDALGRVTRRRATAPGSRLPVRFDDPSWSGPAVPLQPERMTVEKTHLYSEEQELSDTLDRRRGWLQYDYDAGGRLLAALRERPGEQTASPPGERFRYDEAGNLTREGEARAYGPGGRLLRRGEVSYLWDRAGRLVEKHEGDKVWCLTWDSADCPVAVVLPDRRRVAYAYDPFGRRLEARVYEAPARFTNGGLLERTRYVWDGDTLVHAIRTHAAATGDPVVEERTYCFEDGGFVPWAHCETKDDRFGVRGSAWVFYVNDPIGTPEELVDGAGEVVAELDREAWGRTRESDGTRASTPLRFQGQHEDAETGLFYNRFRYYDADAGLYLSPDPIRLEGGLRAYGYGVNPTGWIDPLGLATGTSAAERLPRLRGMNIHRIEGTLRAAGFTCVNPHNPKNNNWRHCDGSEVRVHKYGNQLTTPYKSGNNAHIHKEEPGQGQLTDYGSVTTDKNQSHIGVKNPANYPTVSGRQHGV